MEIENTLCSTDNKVYVGFKSYFLPSASAVYLPTLIDPVTQAQALTAVWTLTTHSLPRPVVPALGDSARSHPQVHRPLQGLATLAALA